MIDEAPQLVLRYPGAKWRISDWIIAHLPEHKTYLEPFFGSGAIFFRKEPSRLETINDISSEVVNLFRVIRERPEELAAMLEMTPWSREEYMESYTPEADDLERARKFLVRAWQSHGSRLDESRNGWRMCLQSKKGPNTVYYRQWQSLPPRVLAAARRLKGAQIENRPALDVITRHSMDPDVLIYADPPYLMDRRTRRQYAHEMTLDEHTELLEALNAHPGPVVLSGYDNKLYTVISALQEWKSVTKKTVVEKGVSRTEVLWLNPVAVERLDGRLF